MKKDDYQVQGLSKAEASKRFKKYGPNQLFTPTKIKFWSIAKQEITEPIILLLFAVGFFYSIWGKLEDTITIVIIVTILVLTEVFNEYRAKKAITSLSEITAPKTKVIRDGVQQEIDTTEVVIGDVLILFAGSKIPADAKISVNTNLTIDESTLTGESLPIEKETQDEIYAGTTVISGMGQAVVYAVGADTKFGSVAAKLSTIKPQRTKLQLEMKALAKKLLYWAVAISVIIPIIGVMRGEDFKTMILTGLALAFAIIPEELPMIITMVLGLGSYNLSKKNFLVKKIKAAETLGTVTTIVTDKTGTLTRGVLTPTFFYPLNEKEAINKAAMSINPYSPSPLDQAILKISKYELNAEIIRQRDAGDNKKTIAVLIKHGMNYELILRGAPEQVFLASKNVNSNITKELARQTKNGRRVIAIASKKIANADINNSFASLEKNLTFDCLIGFEDTPRPSVKETIKKVYQAGIRTIMVTGDHPDTALYIAREVGIGFSNDKVVLGEQIDKMSDDELQAIIKKTSIFARTSPQNKYRIVKSLQDSGEIVGVTGDGVNDVLALKTADIGIAMGIKGTDVAKEAAEAVIVDDNYITISNGIFEGRKLFDNLKKGIKYYLSVKLALIFIFLVPIVLGVSTPFAPIQIIVLEMFMDLAASAGYVAEPMEKDIFGKFKDKVSEGILGKKSVMDIITKSLALFVTVIAVYLFAINNGFSTIESQTLAFSAWVFSHVFLALISRSDRQSLISIGIFKNKIINLWGIGVIGLLLFGIYSPQFHDKLNLAYINPWQILLVAIFALFIASAVEFKKYKTLK